MFHIMTYIQSVLKFRYANVVGNLVTTFFLHLDNHNLKQLQKKTVHKVSTRQTVNIVEMPTISIDYLSCERRGIKT